MNELIKLTTEQYIEMVKNGTAFHSGYDQGGPQFDLSAVDLARVCRDTGLKVYFLGHEWNEDHELYPYIQSDGS